MNKYVADPNELLAKLKLCSAYGNFSEIVLGKIQECPLLLLSPKIISINKPNILVAAGFHGNEPGGPLGVLYAFQKYGQYFEEVNISFLPLINPTGYRLGSHKNSLGQNPNRNFCHENETNSITSVEGTVLLEHKGLIQKLSKDGFLSLHEDVDMHNFYFYTFGDEKTRQDLHNTLFESLTNHFQPCLDPEIEGCPAKLAAIENNHDGSCEDWLFHSGCRFACSTETPGKADISLRAEANADLIRAFIGLTSKID